MSPEVRNRFINILALALSWGCAVAALFIMVSSGTLVARNQANRALATLPVGLIGLSAMCSAIPGQKLVQRFGRRSVFVLASALGITGAVVTCIGVEVDTFALLCLGAVPQGIAYGVANLYRFAAAEIAGEAYKEVALALTVGGAVLSAFIGPEASRHVRDQLDTPLLGAFVLSVGLWGLQCVLVSVVRYAPPPPCGAPTKAVDKPPADAAAAPPSRAPVHEPAAEPGATKPHLAACVAVSVDTDSDDRSDGTGGCGSPRSGGMPEDARPWHQIMRSPDYAVAAVVACVSYFGMAGLMAATPLAMADNGFSADDSTLVIEAHMVAMFGPSFVTGQLVRRVGARPMLVGGSALLLGGTLFYYSTPAKWVFWVALIAIGAGWNLNYVGASNLVMLTYRPNERFVGQGIFDVFALAGQSAALISASFTFDGIGWERMYNVYTGLNAAMLVLAVAYALTRTELSSAQVRG